MKNGDISNQSASSFGVRVDPIARKKLLKSTEYFLDKEVVDFINYVYKCTPYTVHLVLPAKYEGNRKIEELLEILPFSRVFVTKTEKDYLNLLETHTIDYLIDKDVHTRDYSNQWVLSIPQANLMIGR